MAQVRNILADVKKIDTIETTVSTVASNVSQLQTEVTNFDALPNQAGMDGRYLKTNAGVASWETVVIPTALSNLTNDTGFQTAAQVNTAIAALVDSAPSTLDTLNELAAALNDDPNFATSIANQIAGKANLSGGTFTGDVAVNGILEVKNPANGNTGYVRVGTHGEGYPFVTIGGRYDTPFGTTDAGFVDAWYLRALQTLYIHHQLSINNSIGTENQVVAQTASGLAWSDLKTINGDVLVGTGNISIPVYTDANARQAVSVAQVGGDETINANFSIQNPTYGAQFFSYESDTWNGASPFVTGAVITIIDTSFGNGTVVFELTSDLVYDNANYMAWVANYNLISGSISGAGFPATSVSIAGTGGTNPLSYDAMTGEFAFTPLTTDDVVEGTTNLYYTDSKVGTYLTANNYATLDNVNQGLSLKADQSTTYTKTEVNTSLALKANLSGATFTGALSTPQLNINSRKQFDLTVLGDRTNINWDNVTRNSISYALGSAHTNAPLQAVNSIVLDLNTEGMADTQNTGPDTRGAQLWFTDTRGSQDGGTGGRFAIRMKQGTTQHPWEKVLTTYSFRRNFARQIGTMSTSTSTYQDISGCSIAVTPLSLNSRFLIFARFGGYWQPSGDAKGCIVRDGSIILENQRIAGNGTTQHEACSEIWLDHPNTTSVVTYKLQGAVVSSGAGTMDFGHGENKCSLLIMEFEG